MIVTAMNIKAIVIIMVVACLGLGLALFVTKKQATDQHVTDVTSINEYSNQVVDAHERLKEAGQVTLTLSNDLTAAQQQLTASAEQTAQLSNQLVTATTELAETKASLTETKTSLTAAQDQVTNLTTRVSDLELRNRQLNEQAEELNRSLADLTKQIETTKHQLAVTQTNAAFLQAELQKQLAQKAELEHKFNDLDELRGQLKKLKEEAFIARRREWMKSDTGLKKGGQLLMEHTPATRAPAGAYDLNVELGSDRTVKVLPATNHTNAPAH